MSDFKKLDAWQHARKLAEKAYARTRAFPREEIFGLTSQIQRCATSIGANIAESCGRTGDRDQSRFLRIAMGSAREFESHIIVANDLRMLSENDYAELAADVSRVQRLLSGLLRRRSPPRFTRRTP